MRQIVTDRMRLRRQCEAVTFKEGNEIGQILIEELSMRDNAIGLAAPQIGIEARVFAVKTDAEIYYTINPIILSQKDKMLFKKEGCLSFPEHKIDTIRHNKLIYTDDRGSGEHEIEGLEAVVFAHELDHLDGKLMFDNEAKLYDPCFCDSGKKFKFCHFKK